MTVIDNSTVVDDAVGLEPNGSEPGDDSFGLSIVPLDELRSEPRAPWLVKDIIREQSSVLLYGKTGTYKTFLALDLFASLVVGRPWLGNEITKQGPILYVAAEGVETIAERLDAWCQQTGESLPSEQFQVMTTPAQLHDPVQALYLLAWIELHQPIAVAIDTLSKSMGPGTDENSNSDMTTMLTVVDQIKALGVTTVLIHHPGHEHQKRARGGSALEIGVDTSILVERTSDLYAKLTCEKQKRGKHFGAISFNLAELEIGGTDGDPETTLAVVGPIAKYTAGAMEAEAKADRRQAKRTAVIVYLTDHGEAPEAVIAKECEGLASMSGSYRKKFFDAMAADGLIVSSGQERQSRLWRLATS
jgi:RecA-family ATPase